jgi:hypothetical protein
MDTTLDKYWQAVQSRVCVKCIDSDGHGICRLTSAEECGLKVHFPGIVETVLSVQSDEIETYVEALRHNVCMNCKNQSVDGKCMFRTSLDCGLDRYFPLVVEAIEGLRREDGRPEGSCG